ncbi:MAG: acetyl-coenzyme A synthetase N-terminal domain-containing protein, partial [Candidatus Subteraquimicrobiales bacterium]|nr:acetyl-coenzyme A synthetase N-terminal domain-containing protein [Candidatus Subteraquimicrobiales bacterium]
MEKIITSVMEEKRVLYPFREFSQKAHVKNLEEYRQLYKRSIECTEKFWAEVAEEHIVWFKKWDKVFEGGFENLDYKYFIGGKLNASYNCLDRHIKTQRRNKAAIIWQGDSPNESRVYTYRQLFTEVNKFANVLKKKGVKKGDRVTIYLPMIPELPIAMLACARIGAIHSVVFGGFS